MVEEIEKEEFEVDRRGKMRLAVHYVADSRSEAIRGIPPSAEGLPLVSRRGRPWLGKAGKYIVHAIYEGLTEDPDPAFDQYDLVTEEREAKIESFPDLAMLSREYGLTVDEQNNLVFPRTLPKPPSRIGQPLTLDTGRQGGQTPERENPLYGATSYAVPHTTATWRFVRLRVPSAVEKQTRTIIDQLPAGFDHRGKNSKWYVRPLQKRKAGNAWEMEWQAFEVSEFKDLATLLALQGRAREQGLTVTGLSITGLRG